MSYGGKDQSFLVWPVRGRGDGVLPVTGQARCYNEAGDVIPCAGTGQDGEFACGHSFDAGRLGSVIWNLV